jgi:membrane protease YdiL (CAAX protease family)
MLSSDRTPIRALVRLVVEQVGPWLARCSALEIAALAAMAGIGEEVLFRGTIQVTVSRLWGTGWALLVASVLFGLVHYASRAYALVAGVMGLYLGALFLLQGNLLIPIVTHSLYDLAALLSVSRRYRTLLLPSQG